MAPARRHTEISEIPSTVFWTCRSRAVDLLGTLDRCDFDLSLKESLPSLVEVPIIGILRQSPPDRVCDLVAAATDSGRTTVEVTFDSVTPGAQIRSLVDALPELTVGAGTILDSTQARAAIQAGALFLVSPVMSVEVLKICLEAKVPYLPGAATPTELWSADRAGAAGVKVFPARDLGGPGYLSAIGSPLGDISLVATGGVTNAEVGAYLEAGAAAVGLGGSLFSADRVESGDMEGVATSVEQAVSNAT